MTDITRDNFTNNYANVVDVLKKSAFIAFDTEFTGLNSKLNGKVLYNDSIDAKYTKLRETVQTFTILQFGISAFIADATHDNKFSVYTYNFHLFPQTHGVFDSYVTLQVSGVEFLTKHNFDFNKNIYKGIPFINKYQENIIKKKLFNENSFSNIDRDIDEKLMQLQCSKISNWLLEASENETYRLNQTKNIPNFLIHRELRQRFDNIWTKNENNEIIVQKISKSNRSEYEKKNLHDETNQLLDDFLGFTRIFHQLVKLKKPIVGHNMLLDLMFIYEKFYQPLPKKLKEFKENIIYLFPYLYDTKNISFQCKPTFCKIYDDTTLDKLFNSLNDLVSENKTIFSPQIIQANSLSNYDFHPHQAGFDAYMSGVVFIRLAHLLCSIDAKNELLIRPKTIKDYLTILKPYENQIYLTQSSIYYLNLNGDDLDKNKLTWLLVKTKCEQIGFYELLKDFSIYGNCDIKLISNKSAYVGIRMNSKNKGSILNEFRKNKNKYNIEIYNFWNHSPYIKKIFWSSLLVSFCSILYALKKN